MLLATRFIYTATIIIINKTRQRKGKMKSVSLNLLAFAILVLLADGFFTAEAQSCHPSGELRGKTPPPGQCNTGDESECCKDGEMYPIYKCSPPVTDHTKAHLTLNSFEPGKDGGGPSECDNHYHSDDLPIVALPTGWFNHMTRCFRNITINGNGRSVVAMVVDECDSAMGCDSDHDYQPPCDNDIVDASRAVWEALGVPGDQRGWMDITWCDA